MNEHESSGNVLAHIPASIAEEIEQVLLSRKGITIKRILSKGQSGSADDWYDQEDDEWVLVVHGEGVLAFVDGQDLKMKEGDYCYIPAHRKHRVKWTTQEQATVWLAVHFPAQDAQP